MFSDSELSEVLSLSAFCENQSCEPLAFALDKFSDAAPGDISENRLLEVSVFYCISST